MTITYPLLTVRDDSGTAVTGATVTISTVVDADGSTISSPGATLRTAGAKIAVDYDAESKGDAWITLAISKVGSTFTGENANPSFFLARDSGRIIGDLDAAISSRMATYTQPTGFLAATFPATVASTTNITTVAAIGTGGITTASFASGAIDAAAIATDALGALELSAGAANEIADAILSRNVSNVESSCPEHCLASIVLAALEWSNSGGNWVIYRTDGTTTHLTKTLTATPGVDLVTKVE